MQNQLQATIQALLDKSVAEGRERGAQVAVYVEGKLVVDAFAGVADVRTGRAVDGDTVFPVFSTTKGVFATVMHILAERGRIDYDTPISKYWPEFAANGKEAITLRHAMSHTSGIAYMPDNLTVEQVCDWDFMCAAVAQLKPWSAAGAKQDYHPVTYGWILGEVARRMDGRTVPQLLAEEICLPLGMTGIYCGIPAELEPMTAYLESVPEPLAENFPPPPNMVARCMEPLHAWMNRPDARMAPLAGSNGIMSARAVARHYAALLPGGVDCVELLPPARVAMATQEQVPTDGRGNGYWPRGLGYSLTDGGSATSFGHGGFGGSAGYANPAYRLAVSVTRNRFSNFDLAGAVSQEIRQALGITA